jgi:hypothetical protein
VKEFSKTTTRKITAQAARYGMANHVDKVTPFTNDTANLILESTAELVNAISAQNNKKLDDLIKLQTETLATFQKLLHKNTAPLPPATPTTLAKTNALTASATIPTSLSIDAGNYLQMQHCIPPTGNLWWNATPTGQLDKARGCLMKTSNFGNREQLIYIN